MCVTVLKNTSCHPEERISWPVRVPVLANKEQPAFVQKEFIFSLFSTDYRRTSTEDAEHTSQQTLRRENFVKRWPNRQQPF